MISSSSSQPIYCGLPVATHLIEKKDLSKHFAIFKNILNLIFERDFSAPAGIPRQSDIVCVNIPNPQNNFTQLVQSQTNSVPPLSSYLARRCQVRE